MSNSGFLAVPSEQLFYEDTGSGEPIVFIHGFTLDDRMWRPQVYVTS